MLAGGAYSHVLRTWLFRFSPNDKFCNKFWKFYLHWKITKNLMSIVWRMCWRNGVQSWGHCWYVERKSGLSEHMQRLPGFFIPSSATGLHHQITFHGCTMGKKLFIWCIKDFEMHVCPQHSRKSVNVFIWEWNIAQMKELRSSSVQVFFFLLLLWGFLFGFTLVLFVCWFGFVCMFFVIEEKKAITVNQEIYHFSVHCFLDKLLNISTINSLKIL